MLENANRNDHIRALLSQTVSCLCQNSLLFDSELSIEGLIGITLDKKEVLLVNIRELITDNVEKFSETDREKSVQIKHEPADSPKISDINAQDSDDQNSATMNTYSIKSSHCVPSLWKSPPSPNSLAPTYTYTDRIVASSCTDDFTERPTDTLVACESPDKIALKLPDETSRAVNNCNTRHRSDIDWCDEGTFAQQASESLPADSQRMRDMFHVTVGMHANSSVHAVFTCKLCTRPFSHKRTLMRHLRAVHMGESFVCPSCEKTFARKDSLRRHIAATHTTNLHAGYGLPASPLNNLNGYDT